MVDDYQVLLTTKYIQALENIHKLEDIDDLRDLKQTCDLRIKQLQEENAQFNNFPQRLRQ